MHTTRNTLTLAAILLVAPVACGGAGTSLTSTGSGGSSSSGGGPTAEKACADQAQAVCALRETCFPGYSNAKIYGSEAACQSRTAQTCVNALDAKDTGNTPTLVEACATAYPSEACSDFDDSNPVTACVPQAGTLANGATCGASAQCTSAYCAVSQYAVCGACGPLPAVGATCQIQADCGRDLACATPANATSGKCATWVGLSGACLTNVKPCQNGLSCVGDDTTAMTMGTCQTAAKSVGAACDTTRKTMPSCNGDQGLVCIPSGKGKTVGTCQNIELLSAGKTCGDIGAPVTSVAQCAAGGLCKRAAPTDKTGTCVAAAADGAACDNDPSIGPPCLAPAKCVVTAGSPGTSGTCVVPNAATCM